MPRVESSAIAAIDYDAPSATLFITFKDGDEYAYDGVPRRLYDRFLRAESKGRFFQALIRDGFPHRKLPPPPDAFEPAEPRPRPPGLGPGRGGLRAAAATPEHKPVRDNVIRLWPRAPRS